LERMNSTLRGRVVDMKRRPLGDVKVFNAGDVRGSPQVRTAADGSFKLPNLPAGPFYLFAEKQGFRFAAQAVESGREATIMLRRAEEPPPPLAENPDTTSV